MTKAYAEITLFQCLRSASQLAQISKYSFSTFGIPASIHSIINSWPIETSKIPPIFKKLGKLRKFKSWPAFTPICRCLACVAAALYFCKTSVFAEVSKVDAYRSVYNSILLALVAGTNVIIFLYR